MKRKFKPYDGIPFRSALRPYYTVEGDGFDFSSNNGEGYVALSYAGVTAQIYAESLYEDEDGNDYAMELSLGYGNELASGLSYDLTLTGYYDENSYNEYSVTLGLGYGITDAISLGGGVEYYPDTEVTDVSASVEYAFSDAISAYALLGTVADSTDGDYNYAEVGASYGFAEGAAFSVLYEDADNDDSYVSFILSYDFNVFGG